MKRYDPEIMYIGSGCSIPYLEESSNGEYVKADLAQKLLEALQEAVGWNWLDANMPADVMDRIYAVIDEAKDDE